MFQPKLENKKQVPRPENTPINRNTMSSPEVSTAPGNQNPVQIQIESRILLLSDESGLRDAQHLGLEGLESRVLGRLEFRLWALEFLSAPNRQTRPENIEN